MHSGTQLPRPPSSYIYVPLVQQLHCVNILYNITSNEGRSPQIKMYSLSLFLSLSHSQSPLPTCTHPFPHTHLHHTHSYPHPLPSIHAHTHTHLSIPRFVFAGNCHDSGLISDLEWSIYCDWHSFLLSALFLSQVRWHCLPQNRPKGMLFHSKTTVSNLEWRLVHVCDIHSL